MVKAATAVIIEFVAAALLTFMFLGMAPVSRALRWALISFVIST